MAKLIANDIKVCGDCLSYIANGDCGDETSNELASKGCAELLEYYESNGAVFPSGDENEEGFFSWSECECCHGKAGMRYLAGIIE